MLYKVIGIMSGSSLDGLDIAFAEIQEQSGKWMYEIKHAMCISYTQQWEHSLRNAINLSAKDYLLLHTDYGHFIGKKINEFIKEKNLQHQVNLISSHGHTTFHFPKKMMTHQLGDGAAIAAETALPVVTDHRSMDVALGGEGAPIVPLGEKLLFNNYNFFLNIGGITNISIHEKNEIIAYDICPANRILNMLALEKNMAYDDKGKISSQGKVHEELLQKLNDIDYYKRTYPKSLDNGFGVQFIYPLIKSYALTIEDAMCTYAEHICIQIKRSLEKYKQENLQKLFVTGGGVFNNFLISRLVKYLKEINFEITIPDDTTIKYKEALIIALLGVLRWREQNTVLSSVTGAARNSIGGALWLGSEA